MQGYILAFKQGVYMDERVWSKRLLKSYKVLTHMETMKHLEPFYSESYKDLIDFLLATN